MGDKLPSYLYGTYKRSKDASRYCTEWLVYTARDVGYDISSYIKHSGNTTNLPPATSTKERPDEQVSILVRVADLIHLASAIAVHWPKTNIEDKFMRSLKQTLRARKVCAAWFADSPDPDVEDSNQRHLFFIHVLESVLDMFAPLHSQQTAERPVMQYYPTKLAAHPKSGLQESDNQPVDEVTNRVEDFGIAESPFSSALDHEAQPPMAKNSSAASAVGAHEDVVLDESQTNTQDWDTFFILHSLLMDLHRIRAFVRQVWDRYKQGQCDLVTVSALTNMAIDIAINLEKEVDLSVEELMPTLCQYNRLIIKFMLKKMRDTPETHAQHNIGGSDEADIIPADSRDFVFLREYAAALDFLRPWLANSNEVITNAVKSREAKVARK